MGDRFARLWLAVLTLFMLFHAPLMSHKLALACAAATDALLGARLNTIEVNSLRRQLREAQRRGNSLQVSYQPFYGPQ